MFHTRYLVVFFLFIHTCSFGNTSLVTDRAVVKNAKMLQDLFATIQGQSHFFSRNYVMQLITLVEDAFDEMLQHTFCEQVWKQIATTINSTNIKAGPVVGDLAAYLGLLNTDIIRARLMLGMMMSFKDLKIEKIPGIWSIEKCQEYVDAVLDDLDDFSADLKEEFGAAVLLPVYGEQKAWGKKKYLWLLLLLLGVTITIGVGYKIYQKSVEVNKHRQEIKQLMESLASVKVAVGMSKEALAIQEKIKELSNVVGGMDAVLRSNAEATEEFVKATKKRTKELEKTARKQEREMQQALEEMDDYVDDLDETAKRLAGSASFYNRVISKFLPSNPTEFFTKAAVTVSAAGAAKKFAQSISGLRGAGSDAGLGEVASWAGLGEVNQRLARSK